MAQEETRKQVHPTIRTTPKEPVKHTVIVLNDDFTTFEFVIMVMMTVFHKTEEEACAIAESTHINKKAAVGSYSLDIARSKVAKATGMARAEGYPLSFEIQPQ